MGDRAYCFQLPFYHPVARKGFGLILIGSCFAVFEIMLLLDSQPTATLKAWMLGSAVLHCMIIGCGVILWTISSFGGIEVLVENLSFYLFHLPVLALIGFWVWGCYMLSQDWSSVAESRDYILLAYEVFFDATILTITLGYITFVYAFPAGEDQKELYRSIA